MEAKLLLSPEEACEILSIKRSLFFRLLSEQKIGSVKIGRLRRIPVEEVKAFVKREVEAQMETTDL